MFSNARDWEKLHTGGGSDVRAGKKEKKGFLGRRERITIVDEVTSTLGSFMPSRWRRKRSTAAFNQRYGTETNLVLEGEERLFLLAHTGVGRF